jgi:hypothetical protein
VSKLTSFIREHRPLALACGGVVVLGAGIGIGNGISHLGPSSPSSAATASTTSTTALGTETHHAAAHHGVRGQITAENGNTWTVLTKLGKSVSVDITPTTQFGALASPATESSFPVGSEVAATGNRSGTVVTATRIFTPRNPVRAGATTSTTTAG